MQNFMLIEIDQSPAGNGLPASEKEIAISTDREFLSKYCKDTFNKNIQNENYFSWSIYYIIRPTNLIIV